MPTIMSQRIYSATNRSARRIFTKNRMRRFEIKLGIGSPMYRSVENRNLLPQLDAGGRIIWTRPVDEINNRWTGPGVIVGEGSQGLYMSLNAEEAMRMYTLKSDLPCLDLSFNDHPDSILMQILEDARREDPQAFDPHMTLRDLYSHPDDCSFNRAVGNALLETTVYRGFLTSSVLDMHVKNLIIGGDHGVPFDILEPQGRSTYLVGQHIGSLSED